MMEIFNRKSEIEDSIELRLVTTAMALTGFFSAVELTDAPLWLIVFGFFGCLSGSFLSYKRRYSNNALVKVGISVGILVVAALFFNELILLINANIADARVPLSKLLMALIALHCFDLPRRRDLSLSAFVGVILITSAATLSRDLTFSAYVLVFLLLAIFMFQFDCKARSLSKAKPLSSEPLIRSQKPRGSDLQLSLLMFLTLFVFSFGLFALMPRFQLNALKQFRFSGTLPFQFNLNFAKATSASGSGGLLKQDKNAYFGFAEELDTAYRGKLGDQIVLRVSSPSGAYLRGMAYDTYDGKVWRMKRPDKTTELLALEGNSFSIGGFYKSPNLNYKTFVHTVYVEEAGSSLVLCASVPYQIYFPSSTLKLDTYGSIRSPVGMERDVVYTVFSQVPIFVNAELRGLEEADDETKERIAYRYEEYLQQPESISAEFKRLAESVAGKGNEFVKTERLANFLRRNCKYDLDIPATRPGVDAVCDFVLRTKRGFCEQFASALVLMCRSQGVPARIVTGFTPGTYNPFTGLWEIRLCDAHAWVEFYVHGYGWVPMDPTPDGLGAESFEPRDPQSIFSYLEKIFAPIIQKLSDSPYFKELTFSLGNLARVLSDALIDLISRQPLLALFAALLLALFFVRPFAFKPFISEFRQKRKLEKEKLAQEALLAEASRTYLELLKSLQALKLQRQSSETSTDLLREAQRLLSPLTEQSSEFIQKLTAFLELYAELRFGTAGGAELSRLKKSALELTALSEKLAKERKSEPISQ
ncbi:MAG: DUF3488 and transglutaminase-like domain-containing protein [Candidatus Obscuribacterales bacterium]|nr:DUF3488 and transglutaminase-like domain-containing protein [Candidatus Obscuribacterales bacterium]